MATQRVIRRNSNIKRKHAQGMTYRALGRMFKLSHTQIMNIVRENGKQNA